MAQHYDRIETIGQLADSQANSWGWIVCNRLGCAHSVPVRWADLVTRHGAHTPIDAFRRALTCTACGHRGASTMMPSWLGKKIGFGPFPG